MSYIKSEVTVNITAGTFALYAFPSKKVLGCVPEDN